MLFQPFESNYCSTHTHTHTHTRRGVTQFAFTNSFVDDYVYTNMVYRRSAFDCLFVCCCLCLDISVIKDGLLHEIQEIRSSEGMSIG